MILLSGSRDAGLHDNTGQNVDIDEVRAPLPVRREVLYDDAILYQYVLPTFPPCPLFVVSSNCWDDSFSLIIDLELVPSFLFPRYRSSRVGHSSNDSGSLVAFRNFYEEMKRPGVWESEKGATSTAENSRDNLASLYRPPFHLMFQGSFEKVSFPFMEYMKLALGDWDKIIWIE